MTPTSSRLRRALLRTVVLVQLVVLALVAYTVWELVSFGSEVTLGAMIMVSSMITFSVVALGFTFLCAAGSRGQRIGFMSAQAITALAPLVGRASLGFVAPGSVLPPDEAFGPEFSIHVIGLGLLLAAALASLSALLAPLLLAPPPGSTAAR